MGLQIKLVMVNITEYTIRRRFAMKQSDSCKIYNKLCNNSRSDNRFLTGAVFVLSKSIELKKEMKK